MKIFLKNAQETANICWAINTTINVLFECVLPRYTCCIYMLFFQIKKKILFAPTLPSSHHTKSALYRGALPGLHRFSNWTVMLLKTNVI